MKFTLKILMKFISSSDQLKFSTLYCIFLFVTFRCCCLSFFWGFCTPIAIVVLKQKDTIGTPTHGRLR